MERSQLLPKLTEWHAEFCRIADEFPVPEKFWPFLASRLVENAYVQEDANVFTADINGRKRRIRILGPHGPAYVRYEYVDSGGGGILNPAKIAQDEQHRFGEFRARLGNV